MPIKLRGGSCLATPAFADAHPYYSSCANVVTSWGWTYLHGANSFVASPLPPGISLNPTAGIFSGTPTTPGDYFFDVQLANGTCCTSNTTVHVVISNPSAAPVITSPTSVCAQNNSPFAFQIIAPGAEFRSASPLPNGLSINTATGIISGTPTVIGTTVANTTACDACSNCSYGTLSIAIQNSCNCAFNTGEVFGSGATTDSYNVSSYFGAGSNVDIIFDIDGSSGIQVKADGSSIFSSGCPATAGGTGVVPAGTNILDVIVTVCPSRGSWRYQVLCFQ